MKMGKKLKELRYMKSERENRDINQREIGAVIGKSFQAYSLYETNQRQPDCETLVKLADYFEVSADYLLGRSENASSELRVGEGAGSFGIGSGFVLLPEIGEDGEKRAGGDCNYEVIRQFPVDIGMLGGCEALYGELCAFKMAGQSMDPLIRDGDYVLFARDQEIKNDDVVVVCYGGRVLVRCLSFDGDVRTLKATNGIYKEIVMKKGFDGLEVLGKVVKKITAVTINGML